MLATAWAFLTSRVGRWVALVGAGLLAVAIVLLRAFSAGKAAERAAQAQRNLKARNARDEVERDVARSGDDDVRRRLRDDWTR